MDDFEIAKALLKTRFGPGSLTFVGEVLPSRKTFGGARADFDGPGIRLRLALHRGEQFLEVVSLSELDAAGETREWYPVGPVLEFLGRPSHRSAIEPTDVIDEIDGLGSLWMQFLDLFADWPARKAELDRFFAERFERSRSEFKF
jgi:hypothetical protein